MSLYPSLDGFSVEKPKKHELQARSSSDLEQFYEIDNCARWIEANGFKKVCLQFPERLLSDANEVVLKMQTKLNQTVYVMADTSYESCCIDYVTAAHVNADAIVHFGPKCFSKQTDEIPCLKINEKHEIDLVSFEKTVKERFAEEEIVIVLNTPYITHKDFLSEMFQSNHKVTVKCVDDENLLLRTKKILYVGEDDRKLLNFNLIHSPEEVFCFDPKTSNSIINVRKNHSVLKKRNFLIEKIKDSKTVGVVVATLAIKNYLHVVERLKKLLQVSGKKYYVISVGKPTVAKLANFPEIDLYVIVSCALNEIFESRDFYQPLVTPYDVEVALNPNASRLEFSFDYNSYLCLESELDVEAIKSKSLESNVSLISGNIRKIIDENDDGVDDSSLVVRNKGTVALNSNHGAGFLATRSWQGLEQDLGKTVVVLAEKGRKGIAQGYENEK